MSHSLSSVATRKVVQHLFSFSVMKWPGCHKRPCRAPMWLQKLLRMTSLVVLLQITASTNAQTATISPADIAGSCSTSGYTIDLLFPLSVEFEQCSNKWFQDWKGYWEYTPNQVTIDSYYEVFVGNQYQGRFQGRHRQTFGTSHGNSIVGSTSTSSSSSWGKSIALHCNSSECQGKLVFVQTNCSLEKCYLNPNFAGRVVQRQCDFTAINNDVNDDDSSSSSTLSFGQCQYCPAGQEPASEPNAGTPCLPCPAGYMREWFNFNGGYCQACDVYTWQNHAQSNECFQCVVDHTIPGAPGIPQTACNCKPGYQGNDCGEIMPTNSPTVSVVPTTSPTPSQSHAPSATPTLSPSPSQSPSTSLAPSASPVPSAVPSISAAPSTAPSILTRVPIERQSAIPTETTGDLPTTLPTTTVPVRNSARNREGRGQQHIMLCVTVGVFVLIVAVALAILVMRRWQVHQNSAHKPISAPPPESPASVVKDHDGHDLFDAEEASNPWLFDTSPSSYMSYVSTTDGNDEEDEDEDEVSSSYISWML